MAAVLCHVLFRGIFCLWATAAELLHYLFVIWVNWTFKLYPQQHREYQRSRLFPKLRECLVITRRFFHIAPEVHAGRWSVGEQGGRGKWFRRLQQHSETTSSACLVQRHQDCPFSLLRPRSAASSLPQTLRVERVCFPLALTHTHTAPTHPCAHPSFWALGNRANTSFSSSATPSSVCTRSSLHHTHTHTHKVHGTFCVAPVLFLSGSPVSAAGGYSPPPLLSPGPVTLSWSWPWWVCPAPGPGEPGWAAGCRSRSYRRGWARTAAGLALGSSGHSSWHRTRYRSSCREKHSGHSWTLTQSLFTPTVTMRLFITPAPGSVLHKTMWASSDCDSFDWRLDFWFTQRWLKVY